MLQMKINKVKQILKVNFLEEIGFSWCLKALISAAFLKENGSSFQSLGLAMVNALSL